ncbi:MAG: hypothetical protein P1U59_06815 [Alcanivorax sp.]|jgi:hypothetical protein|uniref:hypothetical protein n=1 Tax=Alcanivorax sp. TaxID=1872427 RepID=UPI0026315498|nr:hypothetical protein [Alcanivorax sp.]MDF1724215.1 hypothetical protein [Alcanivorax sp.]
MTETADNVYQDTAYNSLAPRKLEPAPPPEERGGYFTQVAMGRPLQLPAGAQCREPLAEDGTCIEDDQDFLRGPESHPKAYQSTEDAPHIKTVWPTMFEWAVALRTLRYVAAWFAFAGGGFSSIYIFFAVGYKEALGLFTWGFLPLLSIWLLLKLLTWGEPKLKKDTRFYRRTGMVSIYQKGKPRQEIPFDEFDPHMTTRTAATGSTGFMLLLVHRYSDLVISHINDYPDEFEVYLEWENLSQFMDISQPLPDTLINEPARPFDPVTAEYDKKNGRPKHFWRDMSREELHARYKAACQAAKDFPWGKTRDQALAQGWKSSEQRRRKINKN